MSAKVIPKKDGFILRDFEKTVKLRIKLEKKHLKVLKTVMRKEGYGSIDETFNNVIGGFLGIKGQSIYIYPEGFIESGFDLIEKYEKATKRKVLNY